MKYIKFDTIISTNDFLKSYAKSQKLPDFFYVYADEQTNGRGQGSNTWQSNCCKNVLMSIFLMPEIKAEKQQFISQITALAIVKVLQKFNIPNLQIKLPNDILADGKKIAGILIENVINQQDIKQSIIGIGLNVNQTNFVNLPMAISMKNLTGTDFNRDIIVTELVKQLKYFYNLPPDMVSEVFNKYLTKKHQ